jgi:hypothetical protein
LTTREPMSPVPPMTAIFMACLWLFMARLSECAGARRAPVIPYDRAALHPVTDSSRLRQKLDQPRVGAVRDSDLLGSAIDPRRDGAGLWLSRLDNAML